MSVIFHHWLLTRPYSYPGIVARVLFICGFAGVTADTSKFVNASIVSMLMWFFLNWYSESRQKDMGRMIPPPWLVWLPFVITLAICTMVNSKSLLFFLVYMVTIMVYPLKATKPIIGPFGPLLRSTTIFTHSMFVLSFVNGLSFISREFILLILTLSLFHGGRNLVGDIRDIVHDKFELPTKFGLDVSLWILRSIFVACVVMLTYIPDGMITIGVPLAIQWFCLEIFVLIYQREKPEIIGYLGHRLFIVTFTCSQLFIACHYGISRELCFALLFAMGILQITYDYMPGKQYKDYIKYICYGCISINSK
jgi:hypothetical protein